MKRIGIMKSTGEKVELPARTPEELLVKTFNEAERLLSMVSWDSTAGKDLVNWVQSMKLKHPQLFK